MNRRTVGYILLAIAFTVSLTGASCTRKSSTFVDTDEMAVFLSASADGSGSVFVTANISTEDVLSNSSPSVRLSRSDTLRAASIDAVAGFQDEQVMVGRTVGSRFRYEATLVGDENDTRIEVELDRRRSRAVSARDSFVTLPTPFELDWVEDPVTLEPAPINFSRSSSTPFFVVWDPFDAPDFDPGDVLSFRVDGDCIRPYFGEIDWENGEDVLELTGGVLEDRPSAGGAQSCSIEAGFELSRRGRADSRFEFGRFNAYQVRSIELQTMP